MEWLGDLERALATNLYPLRVPIAIGGALAFVGLGLIARRRGWLAAARRHPAGTSALAVLVLALGLPVAWYLGSPLFIRTSLIEPAPSVATAAPEAPVQSPAASRQPTSHVPAAPSRTTAPPTAAPPRTGTFTGADDFHFGRGRATLLETEPGRWVVRFEDFSVRNGPDLYVYLSPDPGGYNKRAVELGRLKATDGDFNTKVPAGTDVGRLRSVVIWCKQFAVQFAVAELR